jgi:hypothetical protein
VSGFFEYTYIIFLCWKDHKDLAQGLVVYDAVTDCVSVYCQFENELSEQVRKVAPFNYVLNLTLSTYFFNVKFFWALVYVISKPIQQIFITIFFPIL